MKLIPSLLMTGCVAALTAGCASGPRYAEYRPSVAPAREGYGRVWFYRPSVRGAMFQPAVKLDNQRVGNAVPHGFFAVETTPGIHEVSAATEWKHKTTINVRSNEDTYVRLITWPGLLAYHVIPKEVEAPRAMNDLKNLHLAASATQ